MNSKDVTSFSYPYRHFAGACVVFALFSAAHAALGAGAPLALSRPATQITASNAVLNGAVSANGNDSVAWFEVGTNTSYGSQTPATTVGSGSGVSFVNATFGSVTPNIAFHYRVVASNSAGIAYGADQVFASSRKLVPWGENAFGVSVPPSNVSSASAIAASGNYSVLVQGDGSVLVWGQDSSGPLAPPPGLSGISTIAAGGSHIVALRSDGTVTAWGANLDGQTSVPPGLSGVVAVAAGANHSLALKNDGTLAAWGNAGDNLATEASNLTQVVAIAANGDHSLALKIDGTVVAWGGGPAGGSVPLGLANVVAIAAGSFHNLALKGDGTVVAWGSGQFGQTAVPPGLANVVAIAAGSYHGLALRADGTAVGWGYDGGAIPPPNLPASVALAAGYTHSFAIALETKPVGISQMIDGPVDADLPITLSGSDPRNIPVSFKVTSLPALGALYQYNSGARGAAITSPDTAVSDVQNRVIFVPIAGGSGSPYANFQFRVIESIAGGLSSDPAIISLNIGTGPRPAISQFVKDGTGFTLGFNGVSTSNYTVLGSATLTDWTVLGSATLLSNSFFQYKDTSPNAFRYYRLRSP